jgi:DNA polymerase III epsilon subunit-like protein
MSERGKCNGRSHVSIIVLDTEFCNTTRYSNGKFPHSCRGVELTREIIEIGAVKLNEKLEIVEKLQIYIQPVNTQFINKNLEELIGITYAELKRVGIKFKSALEKLEGFMGGGKTWILTWDTEDETVLKNNCDYYNIKMPEAEFVDLQALCGQMLFPEEEQKFNVEHALELLEIEPKGQLHEALSDAINEAIIFEKIPDALNAIEVYNPYFYSTGRKADAKMYEYKTEKEFESILQIRQLSSKKNDKSYGKVLIPRFLRNKVYYKLFVNNSGIYTIEKVKNKKEKHLLVAYCSRTENKDDEEVIKVSEWYKKYMEKLQLEG